MEFHIILVSLLSIFFLVSAFVIAIGKGDWMISNYRSLPEEKKARVNIGRLRKVMAAMLVCMAVLLPAHMFVRSEAQMMIVAFTMGFVLVGFLIAAHCWAGLPFWINSFKK